MRNPDLDGPHHPYGLASSVGYAIVALVMLAILICKMGAVA
jgi:hypothetical protein